MGVSKDMRGGHADVERDSLSDLRLMGLRRLASEAMAFDFRNEQVSDLLSEGGMLRDIAANIRCLAKELIERLDAKNELLALLDQSEAGIPSDFDIGREDCDPPDLAPNTALPDPRLIRMIIRQRQERSRYFDGDLFADPAWDMLLDLAAARAEHRRVSVTSLSIASGVPPTTALRWIGLLIEAGLFERIEDETDRRRAFIVLSDRGADAIARYFRALHGDPHFLT